MNSPVTAENQVAVLPEDFSCIVQNVKDYHDQGDVIVLNFETCPNPPTRREEYEAHDASAFFPTILSGEAASIDNESKNNMPVLMVTKQEFECLMLSVDLIELDSETGRLLILPNLCQDQSP